MNRTALRVVAALVTASALAVIPATAHADTSNGAPLAAAVRQARDDYRAAVESTRTTLSTTMAGLRQQVQAEASAASGSPKGTSDAYRVALLEARNRHQGEVDTAIGAAKSALQTARTICTSAIAAAYAAWAPGQPVPKGLLEPGWVPGVNDRPWTTSDRRRAGRGA